MVHVAAVEKVTGAPVSYYSMSIHAFCVHYCHLFHLYDKYIHSSIKFMFVAITCARTSPPAGSISFANQAS